MTESKKYRILWLSVISLLVINLALLAWMMFSPQRPDPNNVPIGPGRIESMLNFDEKQSYEFQKLKEAHFAEVIPIRDSIRAIKKEIFAGLKNGTMDKITLEKKVTVMAMKIKDNELKTFKHMMEIEALCNPEQKQLFKERVLDAFMNQRPKEGNRPMPPPRN